MEIGKFLRAVTLNYGVDNTKACESAPVGDIDLQNALKRDVVFKLRSNEIILRAELESSFYYPVLNPVGIFNPNVYAWIIKQAIPTYNIDTSDPNSSVVPAVDTLTRLPVETFQQNILGLNVRGCGSLIEEIPNQSDPLLLSDYIPTMSPNPAIPSGNAVNTMRACSTAPNKSGKFDLYLYNASKVSTLDLSFSLFSNLYPKLNGDPATPNPLLTPIMSNDKNRVIASYNTLTFYIYEFNNY